MRPDWLAPSLQRRLLLTLALAMVASMVFVVYSVFRQVDKEAEEVLDAWQLIMASDLLRTTMLMIRENRQNDAWLALETARGLENAWIKNFSNPPLLPFAGDEQSVVSIQDKKEEVTVYIWLSGRDRKTVLGEPMPGYTEIWEDLGSSYIETLQRDGHEWRIASQADEENRYRVFVAQRDDLRTYLSHEIGNHLLHVQMLVIPLILLVLWLAIWRGLRPLARLSQQIARRRPGNLQPVSLQGVPREVLPVVEEINHLLERLRATLESERAFTANAAHELRNPLAAMRNLGHVVSEGRDLEEMRRSGKLLEQSMARMSALLSQLLHLARLDAKEVTHVERQASLQEALAQCLTSVIPEAEAKHMEITYRTRWDVRIAMEPELLQMLLHNLLSNAVKYGRVGGQVVVRAARRKGRLQLEVLDNGPGVPEEQLGQLFDRFYRTAEAARQAEGTGLGLAIVRRIAELHEAQVWAENRPGGGLRVVVSFPSNRWTKVVGIR